MSKVITAQQAAMLIKDGATVGASTQGLSGWAEEIAIAIEDRFLDSGHPKDITLVHSCTCGDYKKRGTTHLGHEGLTKRLICGHTLTSVNMINLIEKDKIECYLLPQGVICQLWRAIAGKKIGVITSVGLGTFVDPRIDGGKITSITHEDLVKVIEIEGQELLLYKPFPIDVALIRGTVADENGNLTMDNESVIMEALPLAMAAKNSGGIVIAQAHNLAMANALHPKNVKVPGTLIDYVVIAKPENHWQTQQTYFNPALAGHIKIPLAGIPPIPLDARKIIGRRAAMELSSGDVINLGVGIPAVIASTVAEEEMSNRITITTELGVFGGVPALGLDFGGAINADAMIEHASMFDYYDGGGLDATFVGLAQADRQWRRKCQQIRQQSGRTGRIHQHHAELQEGHFLRHVRYWLRRSGRKREAAHHKRRRLERSSSSASSRSLSAAPLPPAKDTPFSSLQNAEFSTWKNSS